MPLGDYDRLCFDRGCFALTDLALIELAGEDRIEWLQGQVTNDLRQLGDEQPVLACVCTPTGQIISTLAIWSRPGRLLIALPRNTVAAFLERVDQMVIMEDVSATLLPLDGRSIQGPNAQMPHGEIVLPIQRLGLAGWDVWGGDRPIDIEEDIVETRRVESGTPKFGVDIKARTLPPEMGPAFTAAHVSYTKGCYTGQEVLMRIHSRGHTNRTWMGVRLAAEATPGDTLTSEGAEVGFLTSVVRSPRYGWIATAMVKNGLPREVMVNGEVAELGPLPFGESV